MSDFFDCSDPQQRRAGLDAAAAAIADDALVVLPTDTVYGLGVNAFSRYAVDELLTAKGRGREMPVPVLVGSWQGIDGLMTVVPEVVRELVRHFWPGGLTIVVPHAPSLSWDIGDSYGTVAVRMPLHPVALELLARTGPLAVSSANRSGQPPAVTVAAANEQLGHNVAVYLDGGSAGQPVASTIVDVTRGLPRLLRPGAVSLEALRAVIPDLVSDNHADDILGLPPQ